MMTFVIYNYSLFHNLAFRVGRTASGPCARGRGWEPEQGSEDGERLSSQLSAPAQRPSEVVLHARQVCLETKGYNPIPSYFVAGE